MYIVGSSVCTLCVLCVHRGSSSDDAVVTATFFISWTFSSVAR